MAARAVPPAEFSRNFPLDQLGDGEVARKITASEAERAALAVRLGLLALDSLEAEVRLRRGRGSSLIRVSGRLKADLAQACVVTLEPVRQRVDEEFKLLFNLDPKAQEEAPEVFVEIEDEDWPEPVGAEGIDLGEAVAQQLSLAIDPYPRAEGAGLERARWGEGEEEGTESPFAVLERLKRDR